MLDANAMSIITNTSTTGRGAVTNRIYLWPNGQVSYTFDSTLSKSNSTECITIQCLLTRLLRSEKGNQNWERYHIYNEGLNFTISALLLI